MARFNRAICKKCKVVFAKESDDQEFCGYLCRSYAENPELLGNISCVCKTCGISFVCQKGAVYCSNTCRTYSNRSKRKQENAAIATQNQGWVKRSARKRPENRDSAQDSIKRSEYNRVFNDKAWSGYLKGRKWDKI